MVKKKVEKVVKKNVVKEENMIKDEGIFSEKPPQAPL